VNRRARFSGSGPASEPADEFGTVLDETAAFAGARQAMDSLHCTWDTSLRETLRQLGEVQERTDQLAAQVAGNLDLLRRIAKRRRPS
jgi:hypothetical protein